MTLLEDEVTRVVSYDILYVNSAVNLLFEEYKTVIMSSEMLRIYGCFVSWIYRFLR
ncbi:hypothetical protein QNI22_06865 [Cytophagaceae bacterium BD1B2-1]|uniref:Uncharacterized protein n=1 Tax=Xanthocytophaga agilis TaxID=3048010 RepID=A0AAE3UEK3_9BACT|nr:hypothetical protein [Xanthocytophaga agilis]